jgi:hypothetical protein
MTNAVCDKADMIVARQYPLNLQGRDNFKQPCMDIGYRGTKADKDFGQHLIERRANKADPHLGRFSSRALRHFACDLCLQQGAPRLNQKHRARRTQFDIAFGAVEQINPHAELKAADGLTKRRLGHVETCGGAAEMQFLGHRHKLPHLSQVHWWGSLVW